MQLDNFTILVAGCAVLMLQGAMFMFFWARDRRAVWLLWWGLPFVFGGAALSLNMRPGWDADFLAISIGNAARMLALGCLWQGVRLFMGRKLLLWPLLAVLVGWPALCAMPWISDNMLVRVMLVSSINGAFCALSAFELHRDRSEALPSRFPLLVTFTSFATLMFIRAAMAGITPFPMGAGPMSPVWFGVLILLIFSHAAFAAILFFSLTRERREAEQRKFAMSDPLTGLMNRRAFTDFAERMDRRRAGMRHATAVLVLDLDHFKSVNDRFGHEVGDRMLKSFADVSEASVRPSDQLFRMGGEEFCCVLPETNLADAITVAERIRRTFEAVLIDTADGPAGATVSVGIAATHVPVAIDVLLAAADAAVYEAKSRGRNRVVVAEPASLLRSPLAETTPVRRSA